MAASATDLQALPSATSSLVVFLVSFLAYVGTAYPSISGGDAGELAVTTCHLSVAHPPGYPLFTMLGGFFTRFMSAASWGTVAFRLNLLSSLYTAGAALCVHLTVLLLTSNVWAGMFASLGFAFSPTVWLYAIQPEVLPARFSFLVWFMFGCGCRCLL